MQSEQVGEDEFGYMLADILKENNVNNQGMRFDPGARTALAFVTLRNDGEREFMFYRNPSADMLLQEDELDLDLIRKVKPKLQLMLVKLKHNVVKENQTSIEQIIQYALCNSVALLSISLALFSYSKSLHQLAVCGFF